MPKRIACYRPPGFTSTPRARGNLPEDQVERNRFYKRKAWLDARFVKLSRDPVCERCKAEGRLIPALDIHHRVSLADCLATDPALALDLDNLESLCGPCHTAEERRRRARRGDPEASNPADRG
jgi:5-methylcytosine-specific restriction enzyme A